MPPAEPVLTRPFMMLVAAHFLQALGFSSLILLPVYLDALGATRADVGVVMAAAAFGGLLVRPVVAWALDRVGRKPTLIVGTAIMAVSMASLATVQQMGWWAVFIHGIIGVGEAALFTAYFTFAADLVPESRRTEGLALFGISGLVPLVVNPIAGGLGIEGAELRWFFAAISVVVASSVVFVIPLRETRPGNASAAHPRLSAVLTSLRHRALWPVWTATVVFAGLVAVYSAFATVVAADAGATNPGVIWLTYAFGAVTVRLFGASIPDRIGPSRMVPPSLLAYVAAFAVVAWSQTDAGFALSGLLAGFGHGACFPVLSGQAVTRTPPPLRGAAMSLFTALWDVAKLLLVPIAGWLAHRAGDDIMLGACCVVAGAGTVLWAVLERGATANSQLPQRP